MASGIFYPAVSADDGFMSAPSSYDNSSDFITCGDSTVGKNADIRFANITIPQGATINSCFIRLTAYNTTSVTGSTLLMFVAADNQVAFTARGDFNDTPTDTVYWAPSEWNALTVYDSPDLKTAFQEIINRGSWASGNAAVLMWNETFNNDYQAYAIDFNSGQYKAELHVDWTPVASFTEEIHDGLGLGDYDYDDPRVEESLSLSDITFITYDALIEEFLALFDIADYDPDIIRQALEALGLSEIVIGTLTSALEADEILYAADIITASWIVIIADALALAETIFRELGITALEYLFLNESIIPNYSGTETLKDNLYFSELIDRINELALAIADALEADDLPSLNFEILLLEYLMLLEVVANFNSFEWIFQDAIQALDSTDYSWEELIADVAQAIDDVINNWNAMAITADALSVTDTSSVYAIFSIEADDKLATAETLSVQQILQGIIQDSITLSVTILDAGDLWQCWVLNSSKLNPSVFSNFNFNSFCQFQGKSYGMKSDGLYLLEGDTDAGTPVHPGILLTASNFGTENKKYFRSGFIGLTAGNVPAIKIINEDGTSKVYAISSDGRANLSRDVSGKYITVALSNFDTLDFVELIPIFLTR